MSFTTKTNRLKWSITPIVSATAGLLIAVIWMIEEPGFEPLIAIIAGLALAGGLEKLNLSTILDITLAVIITITSIAGITYLCCFSLSNNHAPIIHNLIISQTTIGIRHLATRNVPHLGRKSLTVKS